MKRLGLVGVGAWGRRYADTVSRRTDCRIAAIARASSKSDYSLPGAERLESWEALLQAAARGALDGIIVATTAENQAVIAAEAAELGVPALVEKPLGNTRKAAEKVLARYRESDRRPPIVVDYIHLFAPAYRELKARLPDARSISTIEAAGYNRGPFRSSSSLHDYAPHDLAMCFDSMGIDAPWRLRDARATPGPEGIGEIFDLTLEIGGTRVDMRVGNGAAEKRRRFAVTLQNGRRLVYDDGRPHPDKLSDDGISVPVTATPPLDVLLTYFLERIAQWQAGRAPVDEDSAWLVMSVTIAGVLDRVVADLSA